VIVVDTNVVASFLLRDAHVRAVRALQRRDPVWAVPTLLRSELRNVLWKSARRGPLALADVLALEDEADELLRGREIPVSGSRVLALAVASGCTADDCEFVALAEALAVPLVTWDRALLAAFPTHARTPEAFMELSA
jgi:predicted nucleic acid-binding protein